MASIQSVAAARAAAATPDAGASHVVERGDTLSTIARQHGVSVDDLLRANPQIHDANRIYPGDRVQIPAAAPARTEGAARSGAAAPAGAAGRLPDTENLGAAQKYDLYAGYVQRFGSAEAKADLAAGKQVVLALRVDSNTHANGGHGEYDDRLVVVDGRTHRASEFTASTDPISRYEGRFGQDVDHDGRLDQGRLADGTYSFHSSTYLGHAALKPNGNETVERDTNHDGRFDAADGPHRLQTASGASIADYVHIGGNTDTGSAGCLTLAPAQHAAFFGTLKSGDDIHLVMVDANRLGAAASAAPKAAAAPAAGGAQPTAVSQSGIDLVKHFEGEYLTGYQNKGDVPTIGWGHTGPGVKVGQKITDAQAQAYLGSDLAEAGAAVRKYVKVPLTQGQFDALTSFTFNLGAGALKDSTLLKKLNAGDYAGAQKEFGRWVHADGKVLPGLVSRRAAEAQMFGGQAPATASAAPAARPAASSAAPAAVPAGGAQRDYTVRRGDTLSSIAAAHHVSLPALRAANPQIANPNLIYSGQAVHIPSAGAAPPQAAAPAAAPAAAAGGTARASGRDTVVTRADGTAETRSGGTLAWRNNNPGNIRAGAWADAHGAIGRGPGGFAVFPDRASGERAVATLLQSNGYRNLSVADAIARWAPPTENDTAAYQASVRAQTGLDTGRTIGSLGDAELARVVGAIGHVEGWREGTVTTH